MKGKKVKFEKVGLGEYKSTDGKYVIKSEGYTSYRIYIEGRKIGLMHTVNDAKRYIRSCEETN